MSEKLYAAWSNAIQKNRPVDLDERALEKLLETKDMVKALEALKSGASKPDAYLDSLATAVALIEKVRANARKQKKALGDAAFKGIDKALDDLHTEAEASQKKTMAAANAAAEAAGQEEADTPTLLTSKMLALLRELRKGEAEMSAMICTAGKDCAVLIMRRPISPARRKLLSDALGVSGGAKFFVGTCQSVDKVLTFQLTSPAAGLARKVNLALLAQTQLRLKVKVSGPDGVPDIDGEDEVEAPVAPAAAEAVVTAGPAETSPAGPSQNEREYRQLMAALDVPLQKALRGQHPDAGKLRAVASFAESKTEAKDDFVAAIAAARTLKKLLTSETAAAGAAAAAEPAAGAGPDGRAAIDAVLTASAARYESARKASLPPLTGALAFPEVGGDAVASGLQEADALARKGQYAQAEARMKEAARDAVKVVQRAPYARAVREHQGNIKAAFGIKHGDLGAGFKTAWEAALKLAASGDYAAAKLAVEAVAKGVDAARTDPVLTGQKTLIRQARAANNEAIRLSLDAADFDIKALRALVTKEIGTPTSKSLAAQATEVGDDAGARSREPIVDALTAEQNFKTYDWFILKDRLHKGLITQEDMWDCWRFRQKYVAAEIDKLRKTYPTLIAKTSGSSDLESDIDITFASSEPGDDVAAARAFNALVKAGFGKPPGRVFDVNIYPRDYNAIKESINAEYNADALADRDIDQPKGEMQKLSRVDQDVATLLKQRRFLDDDAFNALMDQVVENAAGDAAKAQVRKQFEEGEDIFLMTALEKVTRIAKSLPAGKKTPDRLPLLARFEALAGKKGAEAEAQRLLPQVLDELEAALPAEVMEATDEMYLEKMATLRQDQTRIARLQNASAAVGEHHAGTCEQAHPGESHEAWRAAESERLKARVKKDQFTNIVFANEAYMSQGAIEHIVAGLQASDEATKQKMLAQLTPATLMQSCNEQLADFFKDMKAVEHEIVSEPDATKKRRETGEAFVHASKYLVRLLDAAQLLQEKFARFTPPVALKLGLLTTTGAASPKALQKRVEDVLLALRKSSTVPADAKGEVGFDEASELFKVADIGAFRKLITDFGTELNQQVRSAPEFQAELAVDEDTERRYFGVPDMPADLQKEVDAARRLVAVKTTSLPRRGEFAAAVAEAEGEVLAAQELARHAAAVPAPHDLPEQLRQGVDRADRVSTLLRTPATRSVIDFIDRMVTEASKLKNKLEAPAVDLHEAHGNVRTRLAADLATQITTLTAERARLQGDLDKVAADLAQELATMKARLPA